MGKNNIVMGKNNRSVGKSSQTMGKNNTTMGKNNKVWEKTTWSFEGQFLELPMLFFLAHTYLSIHLLEL